MLKFIIVSDTHGEDLSRLYTAIQEEISKDSPDTKHVLVMAGDVFSINKLLPTSSNGQYDIDTMAKLAALFAEDARFFVPGNHDYIYEEDQLIELVKQAKFKVVVSNTEFNDKSRLSTTQMITINDGDEMLYLAGLMTPETLNNPPAKKVINDIQVNYEFKEPKPDIILSHLGFRDDLQRLDKGHIFGGHSHDLRAHPIDRPDGSKRYVINGGAYAENLVVACIDTKSKNITRTSITSTKIFSPHTDITKITEDYKKNLGIQLNLPEGMLDKKICEFGSVTPSGADLSPREIENTENHLRITDSVITRTTADALAKKFGHIALFPAAGIRGNFTAHQSLTYENILESFAAGNKIVKVTVTGKELIEGLAKSILHCHCYWRGRGRLLHPSQELSYKYDINLPPGDVIQGVDIKGKPINPDETYTIVTTDWVADYAFPRENIQIIEDKDKYIIANTVTEYAEGKTLEEAYSQRIICPQTLQYQETLLSKSDRANAKVEVPTYNHSRHQARANIPSLARLIPSDSPINTPPLKPDTKQTLHLDTARVTL